MRIFSLPQATEAGRMNDKLGGKNNKSSKPLPHRRQLLKTWLRMSHCWRAIGEEVMHRSVIESLEDRMTGTRSTHRQTHMLQI